MHAHKPMHRMETRLSKRRKLLLEAEKDSKFNIWWSNFGQSDGTDRISNLPDEILYQILLLLPIKCIAQTSVLSKRWRFVWYTLPDLDFTSLPLQLPTSAKSQKRLFLHLVHCKNLDTCMPVFDEMEIDPISNVLAHRGNSCFLRRLRFCARMSFCSLNGLIRSAVRRNVQELDIQVITDGVFNIPRCILASESLRVFKLKSCYPGIRLPPTSILRNGFRSLHQLSLSMIIFGEHFSLLDLFIDTSFPLLKKLSLQYCFGLEHVCFSCRSLKELILQDCFELRSLEIICSKLETLQVKRCLDSYFEAEKRVYINGPKLERLEWEYNALGGMVSFENLNELQHASVGIEDMTKSNMSGVSRLLESVSHVTSITLDSPCLEVARNVFSKYPFYKLKSLELHTGFGNIGVEGLTYLLAKSPLIQNLAIMISTTEAQIKRFWDMSQNTEREFWDSNRNNFSKCLQHLKVVRICGFGLCKGEVSLLTFLIKHAQNLEKMVFIYKHRDLELEEKVRRYFKDLCYHLSASLPQIVFELLV